MWTYFLSRDGMFWLCAGGLLALLALAQLVVWMIRLATWPLRLLRHPNKKAINAIRQKIADASRNGAPESAEQLRNLVTDLLANKVTVPPTLLDGHPREVADNVIGYLKARPDAMKEVLEVGNKD